MKSRLCFLVLVISCVSGAESQTTAAPPDGNKTLENEGLSTPTVPQSLNTTTEDANSTTATNQSLASVMTVSMPVAGTPSNETTTEALMTQTPASSHVTTVSTAMSVTSPGATTPNVKGHGNSSWAYVLLVMIILVIIVLCVILYFLRRASRTYSFDLHRPSPVEHLNVAIGSFEPVYLDDLERPTPKENTTTEEDPPAANGTNLTEEKSSNGHNAAQEHLDVNGLETSPISANSANTANTANSANTGNPLDEDPVQPLDGPSLMFGDAEEQQNENNNNPSVCSSEPFVEISLEEPVWCDQLFSSPQASSSVLPFSPFSFSSSSFSSSS